MPPGFSEGLATENSDKPVSQEPVAVTDLLFGDDLAVLNWTEQERQQDTVEVRLGIWFALLPIRIGVSFDLWIGSIFFVPTACLTTI